MKIKIIILLVFTVLVSGLDLPAAVNKEIFAIRNNTNKSWTQYAIKLTDNLEIFGKTPIFCYIKRPSGSIRPLTSFENRYYGIASQKVINEKRVEATIKGIPDKTMIVEVQNRQVITLIVINGKTCILKSIFITSTNNSLFGKTYIDISGTDIATNKIIIERIKN